MGGAMPNGPQPPPLQHGTLRRQLLILGIILIALAVAGRTLPLGELVEAVRTHAQAAGPVRATLLLALAYAVGELVLIPGSTFSLLAGAVLGPWHGGFTAWLGAATSSAVAFSIARSVGDGAMASLAADRPRLQAIRDRMAVGGWRWVAALRIFPIVPYAVQNYLAGISSIRFAPYWLASLVAMVPTIMLYAWAGHTGAQLALAESGISPLTTGEWLGLGFAVLAVVVVSLFARQRLRS